MTKQDKAIELIQITDPHLSSDLSAGLFGINSYASLQAVVAEVRIHNVDFDVALLTGDLVHDESEQGYRHLRQCLQSLDAPTYLIPGNHDDFDFMQAEFVSGQISCNKRIVLGEWQVLMLNSQVPGQVGGHLNDEELLWLEGCLNNSKAQFTMLVLHHNPFLMGCKWLDPLGLDNSDKLFELVAAQPQVKILVCGHVHQEFDEERAGVRLLSTPSTCIQFKPRVDEFELDNLPPGYRWFRLFADGSLETGVRRLAAMPDGFDPSAEGYGI